VAGIILSTDAMIGELPERKPLPPGMGDMKK